MKSKKQLFIDIDALVKAGEVGPEFADILEKKLNHEKIGDETYGRDSRIYIYTNNIVNRRALERLLAGRGHKIHRDYNPGSGTVELSVTYFKGKQWNV